MVLAQNAAAKTVIAIFHFGGGVAITAGRSSGTLNQVSRPVAVS